MRTLLPIATLIILIYVIAAHRCTEDIIMHSKSSDTTNTTSLLTFQSSVPSAFIVDRRVIQAFAAPPSIMTTNAPTHTKSQRIKVTKRNKTSEHTTLYMIVPIHH